MRLRLYGRSDCHLCDDMLAALHALQTRLEFHVEVLDVDTDPALAKRYGQRIPVLVDARGEEICHARLDEDALRKRLALE
ncbi:MAG: glutaredoxin family protein [Burkholderiales bacterium]|nr:glutaredoxin family protein [Burkholderiales bacterium]